MEENQSTETLLLIMARNRRGRCAGNPYLLDALKSAATYHEQVSEGVKKEIEEVEEEIREQRRNMDDERIIQEVQQWLPDPENDRARDILYSQFLGLYWHIKLLFAQVLQERNLVTSELDSLQAQLTVWNNKQTALFKKLSVVERGPFPEEPTHIPSDTDEV